MDPVTRKLVTIVTETVLEAKLCAEIMELGASGYTVTDARGRGSRGVRDAGWSSSGNIRIEVVCDEGIAEKITAHLTNNYYADYAMILFVAEVAVQRPGKFL